MLCLGERQEKKRKEKMAESGDEGFYIVGDAPAQMMPAQTAQYYALPSLPEEAPVDAGCSPLYCVGVTILCACLLVVAFAG